ncbi:hypothetical protein GGS21DRAFT_493200 [Xylaria nigripes]|nr:hypothetical protein GGS21DRAFT_493200 [Xylaria nigripes]
MGPVACSRPITLPRHTSSVLELKASPSTTFTNPRTAAPDPVLSLLESFLTPPNTFMGGDFNATHWSTCPNLPARHIQAVGDQLADWIAERGLTHLVTDVTTHRAGAQLDLCLSDVPGLAAWVCPELDTTSDHATIQALIPLATQLSPTWQRIKDENLAQFDDLVALRTPSLTTDPLALRTP